MRACFGCLFGTPLWPFWPCSSPLPKEAHRGPVWHHVWLPNEASIGKPTASPSLLSPSQDLLDSAWFSLGSAFICLGSALVLLGSCKAAVSTCMLENGPNPGPRLASTWLGFLEILNPCGLSILAIPPSDFKRKAALRCQCEVMICETVQSLHLLQKRRPGR